MRDPVDRRFDSSFADKPHLRVNVMMRLMRRPVSCTSICSPVASLPFMIFRICALLEFSTGMLFKAKTAEGRESSWAPFVGIAAAVATGPETDRAPLASSQTYSPQRLLRKAIGIHSSANILRRTIPDCQLMITGYHLSSRSSIR